MFATRISPGSLVLSFVLFAISPYRCFAQAVSAQSTTPPPVFSHVCVLVEENHSYNQIVGAADMPYLNTLLTNYAVATNYYANAHPSIPNYFMLTTGRAITSNDKYNKIVKLNNVVRVLAKNQLTWKAYVEDLPGDPTRDSFPYLRHHDPFSYFSDVLNNPDEKANIVDSGQLALDISSNSIPDYAFIVPNAYHSGHGDVDNTGGLCANPNDILAEADCWLQTEIDPLITYLTANNGLLIITWDEGNGADKKHRGGHIPTVIISKTSTSAFSSKLFLQHQSTLRLTLQALGLKRFPGAAQRAPQMGALFGP